MASPRSIATSVSVVGDLMADVSLSTEGAEAVAEGVEALAPETELIGLLPGSKGRQIATRGASGVGDRRADPYHSSSDSFRHPSGADASVGNLGAVP